jgi:CBS domain-containing protein
VLENQNIEKVLTTEVITVHLNQKLSYVNQIFNEKSIHHIPVLEGKKPIGMITTTDIYKLIHNVDTHDKREIDSMLDNDFTIADIMSKDLVSLPLTSTVKDAAGILQNSTRHSVIITDKDGDFSGIVTSTDLIKYLFNQIF